jgi:hypothetical protein
MYTQRLQRVVTTDISFFVLTSLVRWYVTCCCCMVVVVLRPIPLSLCHSTLFLSTPFLLQHLVLTTLRSTTECSSFLFVPNQIFLCRFFVAQRFLFCQSFFCSLSPISFCFFFLFGWGGVLFVDLWKLRL